MQMKWGPFRAGKGFCAAAWTPKGLSALVLPESTPSKAMAKLRDYLPKAPDADRPPVSNVDERLQAEVRKALSGRPFSWRTYDLYFLTPFQQRVLTATSAIPWGQYRTYGWVAQKAGVPKGFRAAGQALNRNPVPILIPCHRVIAANNRLGGYGSGLGWKIELLRLEGVTVQNGTVN
ncbi:MAG TPA: MGMT family protein [bacterium]|nr:MGMT family protein [bacterium]